MSAHLWVELYQIEDDHGLIVVTQHWDKRVLSFGSGMEQGSVFMSKPYYKVHEYTQSMLPGLGGGSLVHCLNHYYKNLIIEIVEYRRAIIDVAYDWFSLPYSPQINVHHADAYEYISKVKQGSTDLIFSDLYIANGMSEL